MAMGECTWAQLGQLVEEACKYDILPIIGLFGWHVAAEEVDVSQLNPHKSFVSAIEFLELKVIAGPDSGLPCGIRYP